MITTAQLHWTAGFFEGEACFSSAWPKRDGSLSTSIKVSQAQREPLERLQRYFGGKIYLNNRADRPTHQDAYQWDLPGLRAVALAMTVYVLMSPKRQAQIRQLVEDWKTYRHSKGENRQWCIGKEHRWIPENVGTQANGKHFCKPCRKARRLGWQQQKDAANQEITLLH